MDVRWDGVEGGDLGKDDMAGWVGGGAGWEVGMWCRMGDGDVVLGWEVGMWGRMGDGELVLGWEVGCGVGWEVGMWGRMGGGDVV